MPIDRRTFLQASAATASAACFGLNGISDAQAKTPFGKRQLPSAYRLKIGTIEVTALFDGMIDLPLDLYKSISKSDADQLLAKAHLFAAGITTAINAYVINTGDRLFLIDAGAGQIFGPDAALIIPNLKAAGFDPNDIDAIILTHMHPDHIGGLLDQAGQPQFPKADLLVNTNEYAFWMDEGIASRAPVEAQKYFKMAQLGANAYKSRLQKFQAGDEITKGVKTVAAYGHTPGHTIIDISSGNDRLFIWGDIVHTAALQFDHPEWSISFDNDADMAIATRKKIMDQVATDGTLIAGMHLDFPGLGYVAAEKHGYSFQPAFWSSKL